jgi:hypothetical protein
MDITDVRSAFVVLVNERASIAELQLDGRLDIIFPDKLGVDADDFQAPA